MLWDPLTPSDWETKPAPLLHFLCRAGILRFFKPQFFFGYLRGEIGLILLTVPVWNVGHGSGTGSLMFDEKRAKLSTLTV